MPRRSRIVPHPLTDFITDNVPQARHEDKLTLRGAHVDSPQSTHNSISSDISVADRSRIGKHGPNDLDNARLSDDILLDFSFLDERRISKRGPHDANDPMHLAIPPKAGLSFSDEPHVMKRSPGEEDDDKENRQDDTNYTPPKQDKYSQVKGGLFIFKDGPRR